MILETKTCLAELEGLITSIPDPLQRQRAVHLVKTLTDSDRGSSDMIRVLRTAATQLLLLQCSLEELQVILLTDEVYEEIDATFQS